MFFFIHTGMMSLCHSSIELSTMLCNKRQSSAAPCRPCLELASDIFDFVLRHFSVFSSTTQQLDERRLTLLTYFSQPPPPRRGPRCEPRVVETSAADKSKIRRLSILHCCTTAWNQLPTYLKTKSSAIAERPRDAACC